MFIRSGNDLCRSADHDAAGFFAVSASLYSMDPSLEESARVAGSNNLQIACALRCQSFDPHFWRRDAQLRRAIESFDTPAIIALPARIEVFTTKIYREAVGAFRRIKSGCAYGVSLLLVTMVFVYLYRVLTQRSERYVTVTGRGIGRRWSTWESGAIRQRASRY
jgi:iron(III) transport system permease protein